jgi:hypothetical protein
MLVEHGNKIYINQRMKKISGKICMSLFFRRKCQVKKKLSGSQSHLYFMEIILRLTKFPEHSIKTPIKLLPAGFYINIKTE